MRISPIFATICAFIFIASFFSMNGNSESIQLTTVNTITNSIGFSYTSVVNISKYYRNIWENRITTDNHYFAPMDTIVKTGGWYLGFIRQGSSHASVGDYGVTQLYRSVDGGIIFNQISPAPFPLSVTNRDVRNYAVGETSSGRIIFIFTVFDCDNITYPESLNQYDGLECIYSDDNGLSWSSRINISFPTLNYFTPSGASPFGTLKILDNGDVGFCYHSWDTSNHTQMRFAYSYNDGLTWNHTTMGLVYNNWLKTETDFVPIGNNNLMALARVEYDDGPEMFTSGDNGLTWESRGSLSKRFPPATSASLTKMTDDNGEVWIFAMFYQWDNFLYSFAYMDDLMIEGRSAWNEPVDVAEIMNVGAYPVFAMTGVNNDGIIIVSQESSSITAYVLIYNITATIIQWDVQNNFYGVVWLLIIFAPPIAFSVYIPKLGFLVGMPLILIILATTQTNFYSVTVIGLFATVAIIYKGV